MIMGDVSLTVYRAAIGGFDLNKKLSCPKNNYKVLHFAFKIFLNSLLSLPNHFFQIFWAFVNTLILFAFSLLKNIRHFEKVITIIWLCRRHTIDLRFGILLVCLAMFTFYIGTILSRIASKVGTKTGLTILSMFALHIIEIRQFPQMFYSHRSKFWLFICGDIELQPGPQEHLRIAHWNLNSLVAHNFSRVSLLQAYMAHHQLHIAAISESALTREIQDACIDIPGYSHIRYDLEGSDTHGGVIIYFRNDLAVINRTDLPSPSYTLTLEISINRRKIFFVHSYRKAGQTSAEAKVFANKYNDLLEKISEISSYATMIIGDFNAHHKEWYDKGKTDNVGVAFKELFDLFSLKQMVNQPTYYNPRDPNSRTLVDLFATNQPFLVVANEIHPPLHETCHHYINFIKMNLKNPVPKPSKRFVWHYNRGNNVGLYNSCKQYNWRQALINSRVKEALDDFDETLLNISKNFIPFEEKVIRPKDPPWITRASKKFYFNYKRKFKRYVNRGCPQEEKRSLDNLKAEYSNIVLAEKEKYLKNLGDRVSDRATGKKKYWSALKKLMNKNITTIIPPIIFQGSFVTDFQEKCNIFNEYFKNQCTLVDTSSTLPPLRINTDLRLSTIRFEESDIIRHIRKLNCNKAHGHDNISARILKICDDSIALPLSIIFKKCLEEKVFPNKWKKANVVPIHKKNEKNIISNYRPVSLLPLCGKIFEKIIFDNLYPYVFGNGFIHDKQSGYRRGDSTVKQLLSITHEIYKAFEQGKELRAVFLDISRAFDRVWHEGLIHKLKVIGIEGEMLDILTSFLKNRKQRVTLDGECSDWADLEAGVPQGSILGPILFLIYINDLIDEVSSDIRIFADDTFIFRIVDPSSTYELTQDLEKITRWAHRWKMIFNPDISKQAVEIVFSNKRIKPVVIPLVFNGIDVKSVNDTKHIGLILDSKLNFKSHLEKKLSKSRSGLGLMRQLKKWVSHDVSENIYKLYVRPNLDYADVVYHKAEDKNDLFYSENTNPMMKQVEMVQYEAARIVTGAWKGTSRDKLYKNLGWESLNERRVMRKLCIFYETLDTKFPNYLFSILDNQSNPLISRRTDSLRPIFCDTSSYKLSFFPSTIRDWNNLDMEIKDANSKHIFKKRILNKIRPKKDSYYGIRNNDHIRYLTMLRCDLSPLRDHKFRKGFLDTNNNLCLVCNRKEDTVHFLLHCRSFSLSRTTLLQRVTELLGWDVSILPRGRLVSTLLYGRGDTTYHNNYLILKSVVDYIIQSKRLDRPREVGGVLDQTVVN